MQPLFEPSQLITVAGLLAARLGVCPLPELAAEPVLKLAEATAIPLVGPVLYRRIDLIHHIERTLSPAAQTVLDELRRPTQSNQPARVTIERSTTDTKRA